MSKKMAIFYIIIGVVIQGGKSKQFPEQFHAEGIEEVSDKTYRLSERKCMEYLKSIPPINQPNFEIPDWTPIGIPDPDPTEAEFDIGNPQVNADMLLEKLPEQYHINLDEIHPIYPDNHHQSYLEEQIPSTSQKGLQNTHTDHENRQSQMQPQNNKPNHNCTDKSLEYLDESYKLHPIEQNQTVEGNWQIIDSLNHTHEVYYVIGGKATLLGEFPHMAAIGWTNSDGSHKFDCGGTLISPRFVLTAAHCTYSHGAENPYPQVVRLGDQNIDSTIDDGAYPTQIPIKKIHKHPAYTRKQHYNDIALLELSDEVVFTPYIRPACLQTRELGSIKSAIATGWGVSNPDTNERSNNLQKVDLSILNKDVCRILLRDNINRKWEHGLVDTQICAGEPEGGKDTCQGDSGSPLQIISEVYPHYYYVIGVTSFGPRVCARLPAIYTRVSSYVDWIESIVWPEEYRN